MNTFQTGFTFITNEFLKAISDGLAKEGIHYSVEKLLALTNTPQAKPTLAAMASTQVAFGGPVPTMVQGANNKVTHLTAPIPGKTCMYKFKRGPNKEKFCPKACTADGQYCTAHNTYTTTKEVGALPGVAPSKGRATKTNPLPGVTVPQEEEYVLQVDEYDISRGLYIDKRYRFIIHKADEFTFYVVGKQPHGDDSLIPLAELSDNDLEDAKALGLTVPEQAD